MERVIRLQRALVWIGGAAVAALASGLAVRAFAAPPGVLNHTGCLRKTGAIVDVAPGDQPASPCKGGDTVIHLGAGDVTSVQTPVGGGLRGGGFSGDISLSLAPVPAARVKGIIPLQIPDNTFTLIPLHTVEFDTAGLFNPADPTRLTAPVAGIYTVSAHVDWDQNNFAAREVMIDANIGIVFQRIATSQIPASNVDVEQSVSTIVQLSAGDSVQLEVRQVSGGGSDNIQVSDHSPTLAMAWLGPAT